MENDGSSPRRRVPGKLRQCLNCPSSAVSALVFKRDSTCPFLVEMSCKHCNTKVHLCAECPNATSQFSSPLAIKRHLRHAHATWFKNSSLVKSRGAKRKTVSGHVSADGPATSRSRVAIASPLVATAPLLDDDESMADTMFVDEEETLVEALPKRHSIVATPVSIIEDVGTGRQHNNAAFFFNEKKQSGGGLKYLVGMSRFGMPNLAGDLDDDEVAMYAKTAELASHLTKPNRDRLANLTKSIQDVVTKQTVEEQLVAAGKIPRRSFIVTPLTTPNALRMELFEKPKALFKILPHPPLLECDGHAYSLYSDCVRDALGKGYDLDLVPQRLAGTGTDFPLRDISSTPKCKALFDLNLHTSGVLPLPFVDLWMTEWSDDADPNSSIKSNRGSFWFKSLTISPTKTMIHSMSHTYPLAMGHKNANHDLVGQCLIDDLATLGSDQGVPMYSKRHGGMVLVRARLFACLMDQPERRGENHLMAGNSHLHKRFGFSFPWHSFEDVLRPCDICKPILLAESDPWTCPDCPDCTNFAFDPNHSLFAYEAPEFFPIPLEPGEMLRPFNLEYSSLISAVTLTHNSYVEGLWCVEESEAWLDWFCLNTKTVENILLHAEHCKERNDITGDPNSTQGDLAALAADMESEPNLYERWPIPSLWRRGLLLNQCPDIPMHLLFLGCVKTVMKQVKAWMANKRKSTSFAKEMTKIMESLDHLKLSWLKILPYKESGKFGGWVSENFVAMSRILKWFYSLLDRVASDKVAWVEPVDKPQNNWTAIDNKGWLRERGLPLSGRAKALKERVYHYMNEVDPVPPVVEMLAGPVSDVLLTISSLDELISILMVEEIPNFEYYMLLERKIRIFLCHFADMEEQMPQKKGLPQWLSSYNFLSLLNLPEVVRQFGPLRNLWEGGPQGEGILRFVKPNMLNGMRRSWELSSMSTLMWKKALDYVVNSDVGTAASRPEGSSTDKMYHVYPLHAFAIDPLLREAETAVSCVQADDGRWGIVCGKSRGSEYFHEVDRAAGPMVLSGLNYFLWLRPLGEEDGVPVDDLTIIAFGLLLPLLQSKLKPGDDMYITHRFALVSSDHRTLDHLGDLTYA
jgi:hypothetical protein